MAAFRAFVPRIPSAFATKFRELAAVGERASESTAVESKVAMKVGGVRAIFSPSEGNVPGKD